MRRGTVLQIAGALALTLPWVVVWGGTTVLGWAGAEPVAALEGIGTGPEVFVTGLAVLGASFMLAWGAETAEKDVPRAFAIAVLAVLAVAPEYAVDALYAWNAGALAGTPEGAEAGNLAVANMTGANRILIGIGWSGIALMTIYRARTTPDAAVEQREGFLRDVVTLDRDVGLEIVFLFAATLWAFFVPLMGGIDALDFLILVGLYAAYIAVILRGPIDPEEEHVGVPADLQEFPKPYRVTAVLTLFAFSGLMIFTAVEPFAHGLEELGTDIGVPSFFMIQWIAPLASESPELIVVAYLVNKSRSTAGFNALISSKLNQWTLLIGTLVVVHSIALGEYGALEFDSKQAAEIWITAAQSFFAIAILVNFEISLREAVGLLVLFVSQVFVEFLIIRDAVALPFSSIDLLLGFTVVYVVLGLAMFVQRRRSLRGILERAAGTIRGAFRGEAEPEPSGAD